MDMIKKINKGVGVATTAMIIVSGTPMVAQAIAIPKIEAKAICKDIEKSIKNGTYEVNDLNKNLYSNINNSSQKQEENNRKEEIKVKVLKENSNDESMAGTYIGKVEHEINNGKHYIALSLDSMDWMSNITASIDDGQEVTVTEVERSAKKTDDGKGKEIGIIKFEVKDLNSKILMHMNVQPMGNSRVAFRLVPEAAPNDAQVKPEPKEEDIQSKNNQKDKENASKEVAKDKIKDGIYSIGFNAYKLEDKNETSMLNNFFDKKAKLEVKDGQMKITLLNICFADGLYDFRIESNGKYPESVAKGYGELDHKGKYPFKTFEINISDIDSEHQGCVLVGPMGGLISDVGNFDKYKKVMFVFDKNNLKEWNGFDEDHKKVDDDKQFNKALLEANLDIDGDGIVTNEELALAEGEVNLARKKIKDISRLKFLGKNVTALDLTGNKIEELPEGVFNNLTKLKKLDIHGNEIKKLPNGIFDKLTELTDLHIGMNDFKELPQGIFDRLTKLKQLSIYNMDTPLNEIDDNAFSNLKNLEYLSLEETGISKVPQGIFKLTSLNMLNLSKNELKIIPKELANLKNLTWLNLGTNYIEEIPDEVYESLNKLTMFEIKDNQLTKIPLNIWDLMPENKRLDCSLNKLEIVPKLPDPSKGKRWLTSYPQKQLLKLDLLANDGQVKWNQELSALDMIAWFKMANAFNTKKIPENVNEYKEQLGNKTTLEFLKEKECEPRIVTQIQKKYKDGKYKTIKEIVKFNEEDSDSSYIDPDMKNGDEYRILKKVYVISYSYEYYIFTDVSYAKATVSGNSSEKPVVKPDDNTSTSHKHEKDNNLKDDKDTKKDKEDVSKEVKTENKKEQKQNKVASTEKSSINNKTEEKSNKKATEIKEKKLPQTGMPFGSGLLATIGSAISGLGIVIGKKNRKNKR